MLTLQIKEMFPIKKGRSDKYRGIANDNSSFYLSMPDLSEIHKYDFSLKDREVIKTNRGYRSISYDEKCKCFWAVSSKVYNKIFKLDLMFKEKEVITIRDSDMSYVSLTSVSCIADSDKLLISFNGRVGEVDKSNGAKISTLQKSYENRINSVEALNKYYVASTTQNYSLSISIYSYSNELKLQCCLPEEYEVQDMTHIFCEQERSKTNPTFYILATKKTMYYYLLKCTIEYNFEDKEECIEDFLCDPRIKKSMECIENSTDCIRNCTECGKKVDCKKNINDIIESIALIETALSHILNAEGQKIEKTICMAKDPCELIRVNDSVNKTIVNITHLEQILFSKLQLAEELYNKMI